MLGIRVTGARRATIESNTVHGVGAAREVGSESVGIDVLASVETRVAGNSVDRIGFPESGGEEIGIAVRGRIRRCQIDGNTARRQPVEVDDDNPTAFHGLLVGADVRIEEPSAVSLGSWVIGAGTAVRDRSAHRLCRERPRRGVGDGGREHHLGERQGPGGHDRRRRRRHRHGQPCASVRRRCAGALVHAQSASVAQNRLRGGRPSGELDVDPKRVAVVGNLSSVPLQVRGAALGAPWVGLNPTGF